MISRCIKFRSGSEAKMKQNAFILLIFIIALQGMNAQNVNEKVVIKNIIERIFTNCENKTYDRVLNEIAFEKKDDNKLEFNRVNPEDTREMNYGKRILKAINALLKISDSWIIGDPQSEQYNNRNIFVIKIEFTSGDQKIEKEFRFIKLQENLLLFKID